MGCAANISQAMGMIDIAAVERGIRLIEASHLPIRAEGCTVDQLYGDIFHDKKTVGGKVKWILMDGSIGTVTGRNDVPEAVVREAMGKIV